MSLLYTTLAALFVLLLICAWTSVAKGLASEEGKLAFGALVTIVGTLLGYFTGKNAK
jgi:hypothetical protein